jgi:hypothetical protein
VIEKGKDKGLAERVKDERSDERVCGQMNQ